MSRGRRILHRFGVGAFLFGLSLLIAGAGGISATAGVKRSSKPSAGPAATLAPHFVAAARLQGVPQSAVEVPSMRTRRSRTYQLTDGSYQTVMSQASVNYQDSSGAWQPIDDTLVPSTSTAGAYENKANGVKVLFPANLSSPVELTEGNAWVKFALLNALPVPVSVAGASASYQGALPGDNVVYTATADGLHESLVMADAGAVRSFSWQMDLAPGLSARLTPSNGIELVDAEGNVRLPFAPPMMTDASGAISRAISYTLTPDADGYLVTTTLDPDWLASGSRAWPVTVDPGSGPYTDCTITGGSSANTSFCAAATLDVGYDGSKVSRILSPWTITGLPAGAVIESSQLSMNLSSETNSTPLTIEVHQLTQANTVNATWNKYDGTNNWTTPGGDYSSNIETSATVGGTLGLQNWYVTHLVQQWWQGVVPNDGFLLKASNESTANVLHFDSLDATGTYIPPTLSITWTQGYGLSSEFTYDKQSIDDRTEMSVNVANGNLVLHQNDFNIADTAGLNLALDRYYNSLDTGSQHGFGLSWHALPAIAFTNPNNTAITVFDGSAMPYTFTQNPDGSFSSPPGIDATFAEFGGGTSFSLTFHATGLVENFNSSGKQPPWSTRTATR